MVNQEKQCIYYLLSRIKHHVKNDDYDLASKQLDDIYKSLKILKEENKAKFKVGDKIRILNAESIEAAVYFGYKNGDEALVVKVDNDGDPYIPNKNNIESCPLVILEEELKYIKKIKNHNA